MTKARPVVMKTAVGIVVVTALVAFAGRIAAFALEPVLATYRTGHEIQALEKAVAKVETKNARLKQDITYLKTPAGVEQEARRRGWVRKGEVAMSVIQPETVPGAAPLKPASKPLQTASAEQPASLTDQFRTALDTCLAVFGGTSRPR